MRISTNQMYRATTATISNKQADLAQLQNQLATGKRSASLADDPAAAAGASVLRSDLAANSQFEQNRQIAQQRLSFAENTLGSVSDNLQTARDQLIAAGNGSLSDLDRKTIAGQLRQGLATLVGLANSADGQGGYLFGGYREDTPPFVENGAAVNYVADDGARVINVSSTRSMETAFNGADVFMRIPNGNGLFVSAANSANTGSGIIDSGRVANPAALTGNNYEIRFQGSGSTSTYDVWDTTTNTAISTGTPFTAPASIAVPGISINVDGAPANGDKFSVLPSGNQDVFKTLRDAIAVLETPTNGNVTAVANGLRASLANLDQALNHISDGRGAAGARLNELDQVGVLGSSRDVDLKGTLSKLEDIDYVKTISDFTVTQTGVQAALASYAKISQTSLFDYLR